ncbi:hypothetical protein ACIQUB_16580 [Rhizobium sp. NPDC090275]|uniref:hypothetical protein n=1 Tax=Rhizobium sp. NPDC090275 TaxID=3364498 RepID=UPI00383BF684
MFAALTVFLEGAKAALMAASDFQDGWYKEPPEKGLRAMARVYAGWCVSQSFYLQELDKTALGFPSLEEFLVGFWESLFLPADANNLLAMIATWQAGDISDNPLYHGDCTKALGAIKAQALVMPCRTDLYFPPQDNEIEVACMPKATLKIIESVWGHFAGGPGLSYLDGAAIDGALKKFISAP